MHAYLVEMLECPVCHGGLSWHIDVRVGDRIEQGEARCDACGSSYPVRDGIGLFLTPDLPRNDLWEGTESGLLRYLTDHPEVERRLMDVPVETLNPADRFFRAMVLEQRGDLAAARAESRSATETLYTPEYLACSRRQLQWLVERLAGYGGPVIDLASGRGALVEEMARRLDNPLVMTDFSPTVLRRNRRMLEHLGLQGRVSLLAFDARRTPFKDGAIGRMTSYLGLANVEQPGGVLAELRRVVGGEMLSVMHFFPEDDEAHRDLLRERDFLYEARTVQHFRLAGWDARIENACRAPARPTSVGAVLEGFGIDGLPVAPTVLDWCVLNARPGQAA